MLANTVQSPALSGSFSSEHRLKKKSFFSSVFVFLLAIFTASFSVHAQSSVPSIGGGYGVQIKLGRTSAKEFAQIKDAGFGYVRFGMSWNFIEPQKGRYDWADFDRGMTAIRSNGLRSIVILGTGNTPYTGAVRLNGAGDRVGATPLPPTTDDQLRAFAGYVTAVVSRYKGADVVWEIWNEPDLPRFWPPAVDANAYVKMAEVACNAIRQADPSAKIIGPAYANFPALAKNNLFAQPHRDFMTALLKSPAATCLNAISVHPYRQGGANPESAMGEYTQAKQFVASNIRSGVTPPPLVDSEWGFTTADQPAGRAMGRILNGYQPPRVDETTQGAYVLRDRLVDLLNGVDLSIWYEWRDSFATPATDPEARFGLLYQNGTPKASMAYLLSILPAIKDARVVRRVQTGNPDIYVVSISFPDGSPGEIFWTTSNSSSVALVDSHDSKTRHAITAEPQLVRIAPEDIRLMP